MKLVIGVSKFYSAVIEFNVWLWNRIRIADYFPALMLPEGKINSGVGFQSF